jgi:D-mannonate dehydratase
MVHVGEQVMKRLTIKQLEDILRHDERFEDTLECVGSVGINTTRYFINSHSGWVRPDLAHVEYVEFNDKTGKSVETLNEIQDLLDVFSYWSEDPELKN